MVDKTEVYLNIKINYEGKQEIIKSTEILKIDEIKSEIIRLFLFEEINNEDMELYNAKNNKLIFKDDDIFILAEEENEYLYTLEINLKNNNPIYKLINDKKKIKEGKEKIRKMKLEKEKLKHQIIYEKKLKELKNKINSHKKFIEIKNRLVNEILPESKKELNDIINNNIIKLIDDNINSQANDLKLKLSEEFNGQISQIKQDLDKKKIIKFDT